MSVSHMCIYIILQPRVGVLRFLAECRKRCTQPGVSFLCLLGQVFPVRLHVMQCTVLLSQFCLSLRPSVCQSDACIVTKLNDGLRIFDATRYGNHSSLLTPTIVDGRCPFPLRTLPLIALKGGSKSDFFVLWVKVNGWSSQVLSKLVCWWVS